MGKPDLAKSQQLQAAQGAVLIRAGGVEEPEVTSTAEERWGRCGEGVALGLEGQEGGPCLHGAASMASCYLEIFQFLRQ